MNFLRYDDHWTFFKRMVQQKGLPLPHGITPRKMLNFTLNELKRSHEIDRFGLTLKSQSIETDWIEAQRPYYRVYPAIIPMLLKLNLDVPCETISEFPIDPLCLSLPDIDLNDAFAWFDEKTQKIIRVHGIIVSKVRIIDGYELAILVDIRESTTECHAVTVLSFKLSDNANVETMIQSNPVDESFYEGLEMPDKIKSNIYKLCCCVRLIGNDPELVSPDILKGDIDKWETATEADRDKFIKKAHAAGKVGWNLGAGIEVIPHMRRPHPALVWYGTGKQQAKIVLRKGSVVHRAKLANVPHGYEGSE